MRLRTEKGDTIIEVLLAITIFSLVSVGAMTIMNQGTNAAQRALEITLVRQQIDAQAEALRAAQQAFASTVNPSATTWQAIKNQGDSGSYDKTSCPVSATDVPGSFILDARSAKTVTGDWLKSIDAADPPYAQVDYANNTVKAYGLWIEQKHIPASSNAPAAYNFTIRACWYGAGMGTTPLRIETLVRLYDPS